MANIAKHKFVSAKSQSPDNTLVSKNEWNDEHVFAGGLEEQFIAWRAAQSDKVAWQEVFAQYADGSLPSAGRAGRAVRRSNAGRGIFVDNGTVLYPLQGFINVAEYATSGNGSSGSPWSGWDTTVPWAANGCYVMPNGYYTHVATLQLGYNNLTLIGLGEVILQHTGSDPNQDAVSVDAGAGSGDLRFGVHIANITIRGSGNDRHGLYIRGSHHMLVEDVTVIGAGASRAGVAVSFSVLSYFKNIRVTSNYPGGFYNTPNYGIFLDERGAGEIVSSCTFENVIVEGLSGATNGIGIYLNKAQSCTFVGGASESNKGGIHLTADAYVNTFIGMFVEVNSVINIDCAGFLNHFINMHSLGTPSSGQVVFRSGAYANALIGGNYSQNITISAGVLSTYLDGILCNGTISDSGAKTFRRNCLVGGAFSNDQTQGINGLDSSPLLLANDGDGINIGQTGHVIKKFWTTTIAYGGGTINDQTSAVIASANLSGVFLGYSCTVSINVDAQGLVLYGYVDADGHVKVSAANVTGGNVTLGACTVRVNVWQTSA